jgi:hypothetical protein
LADRPSLSLLPLRCPRCSGDVGIGSEDVIFLCRRCLNLWEEKNGSLRPRRVIFYSGKGSDPHYIPFWKFHLSANTPLGKIDDLESYARNIAFGESIESGGQRPLTLYVAAPPLRVEQHRLNLSERLTHNQPLLSVSDPVRGHIWGPVIDEASARNYAKVIFISTLSEARKGSPEFVSKIDLTLKDPTLVYIPFLKDSGYLRDPKRSISIHENSFIERPTAIAP